MQPLAHAAHWLGMQMELPVVSFKHELPGAHGVVGSHGAQQGAGPDAASGRGAASLGGGGPPSSGAEASKGGGGPASWGGGALQVIWQVLRSNVQLEGPHALHRVGKAVGVHALLPSLKVVHTLADEQSLLVAHVLPQSGGETHPVMLHALS